MNCVYKTMPKLLSVTGRRLYNDSEQKILKQISQFCSYIKQQPCISLSYENCFYVVHLNKKRIIFKSNVDMSTFSYFSSSVKNELSRISFRTALLEIQAKTITALFPLLCQHFYFYF